MPANVESLRQKVRDHGEAMCVEALKDVEIDLDREVPDSDRNPLAAFSTSARRGPKLRTSRVVSRPKLDGDIVTTTITYTADHANFTNDGVEAHEIKAVRAPHLVFWFEKVGHIITPLKVDWVPGAGIAENIGWFERGLAGWSDHLETATLRVRT